MRLNPLSEGAISSRRWPSFDPDPTANLVLDFIGSKTWGRPYYKLASDLYAAATAMPGWSYSGSTSNGQPRYAETRNGILVPFAQNVPRITDRGLLIEESRQQLARNNRFQDWTSAAPNGYSSPIVPRIAKVSGVLGDIGLKLLGPFANDANRVGVPAFPELAPSTTYTLTARARKTRGTTAFLALAVDSWGSNALVLDLSSAALNQWVTVSVTATSAAGTGTGGGFHTGSADCDIEIDWWQLEAGSARTSVIVNDGQAAVTRSADVAYITGLAQILAAPVTVAVVEGGYGVMRGYPQTWALDNGVNRIEQFIDGVSGALWVKYELQGADRLISGVGGSGPRKMAVRIRPNDLGMAADGVLGAQWTNLAALQGMNRLTLGARTGGSQFLNGYIQRIQILGDTSDSALVGLSQ